MSCAQNKKEQIELLLFRSDSLTNLLIQERNSSNQRIQDLTTKVSSAESKIAALNVNMADLKKELARADQELLTIKKEQGERSNEITQLNERIKLKSDSLSVMTSELKKLKTALSAYASLVKINGEFVEWKTVKIGSQIWLGENLNIATFRNGDKIPEAKTAEEWQKANDNKQPAWCYYNNDPKNGEKYGKLYNGYAVNDKRGLAPEGWRIPTDWDWELLEAELGGYMVAGNKMMKTTGEADLHKGTNISGFDALPAGYRVNLFERVKEQASYWAKKTSREFNAVELGFTMYTDGVYKNIKEVVLSHGNYMPTVGFSVRLIREAGME